MATAAKPFPASPAFDASIDAFNANIFDCCDRVLTTEVISPICCVWLLKSRMVCAISFIFSSDALMPWILCSTDSVPSFPCSYVFLATSRRVCALVMVCFELLSISSNEALISLMAEACDVIPSACSFAEVSTVSSIVTISLLTVVNFFGNWGQTIGHRI